MIELETSGKALVLAQLHGINAVIGAIMAEVDKGLVSPSYIQEKTISIRSMCEVIDGITSDREE